MNSKINFKNLLKNLDYRYPSLINFRNEIEKASWLAKYNAYGDRRNRVIFSPYLINNDINKVSQLTLLAELNESYNF